MGKLPSIIIFFSPQHTFPEDNVMADPPAATMQPAEVIPIHMLPLKGRQLFGAASKVLGGVQARKLFEDPQFVQLVTQILDTPASTAQPAKETPKQTSKPASEGTAHTEKVSGVHRALAARNKVDVGTLQPVVIPQQTPQDYPVGTIIPSQFGSYCHLEAGFPNQTWDLSEDSGATHILALDVENCPAFFADCALWEIINKRKYLPPGCYVVTCISTNAALQKKLLIGHVLEDLIKRNRLSLTKVRSSDSNASDFSLTTRTMEAVDITKRGVPVTLISADNDFDELHRTFFDEGVAFTRYQSYVGCFREMRWNSLLPEQWADETALSADAELFFSQLQRRFTGDASAVALPVKDMPPAHTVTEVDYGRQVPVKSQLRIIHQSDSKKRNNQNKWKPSTRQHLKNAIFEKMEGQY